MRLGAALTFCLLTCGLGACNYVIGYNKLWKANRVITQLPDGALVFASAVDVQVGAKHSCATFDDGSLRCWGQNDAGQLGVAGTESKLAPILVPNVHDVASVSLGERHTCAVLKSGDTYCWGANDRGQLGLGFADGEAHDRPTQVASAPPARAQAEPDRLTEDGWTVLSTNGEHTCGIRDGAVACFGRNDEGQLGLGHRMDTAIPTPLSF